MPAMVSWLVSPASAILKARAEAPAMRALLKPDGLEGEAEEDEGVRSSGSVGATEAAQRAASQAAETASRTCTVLMRRSRPYSHFISSALAWYTRARHRPRARKPLS